MASFRRGNHPVPRRAGRGEKRAAASSCAQLAERRRPVLANPAARETPLAMTGLDYAILSLVDASFDLLRLVNSAVMAL